MWGLTLVGLFLILGLFTRLASLAGIGFILMFYLAAPPLIGYFYSIPSEGSYLIINKNLVELCALAVIFATGSGKFAGLDRIVHGLIARPRLAAADGAAASSGHRASAAAGRRLISPATLRERDADAIAHRADVFASRRVLLRRLQMLEHQRRVHAEG